jgi:hypothetical protein
METILDKKEVMTMPYANPAEVEKCLKGINYPAKKDDLIKHAQQQGANKDVIDTLKEMREENFNSPIDVSKAVGEVDRRQ